MKKDPFFEKMANLGLALTYDDVRLRSGYSETDPRDVLIESFFSKNIPLHCPIVSAPMDTVTESKMAIAMAKLGGLGIIHKGLTPEIQSNHVKKVKLHLNGLIEKPITVKADDIVGAIEERQQNKDYGFHSFPVVDEGGKLIGLISRNDFDLNNDKSLRARDIMTVLAELITAPVNTSLEEAYSILKQARKKILPLINDKTELTGLYVFSDVNRLLTDSSSLYNVDKSGHLRVGAAVGTGNAEIERASLLVRAGVDVLVIDTAHGDSKNVYETLKTLKQSHPKVDIVVGNVSEGESAKRLVDAGADGIKIGQGPGSICTTRIIAGIGCPQVTAVYNCAKAVRGSGVPVCADGGIKNSGDITIALGLGAHSVMLGRVLAGTTETPGEIRLTAQGRMKIYRGMGSLGAMQSSRTARERYRQGEDDIKKLVPEGIESVVSYQGDLANVLFKQIGGLRSGMGYVGAKTIAELQEKADFHRLSGAGMIESHPHDVTIIDSAQ